MLQRTSFDLQALTVSEITQVIRAVLESESLLEDVRVSGEISNLKYHTSGHVYFTLKDESASIRCVMWKTHAVRLQVRLQDGMAVQAHGRIGVYERSGDYQLYVDAVQEAGEGWLYREFLRLKDRLEKEGLFDEERKKPVPVFPQVVGIITSATGAALQDVLNTLRQRYPAVRVVVAPAAVQGKGAASEIAARLAALQSCGVDVILLVRGGGSIEDLWPFNEETVVRAVAASSIPVISGIGHETDFTLSDFAADYRAPTPTGAAVYAVPDREELLSQLVNIRAALSDWAGRWLKNAHTDMTRQQERLMQVSPLQSIQNERQRVDILYDQLSQIIQHRLVLYNSHLQGCNRQLQSVNPMAVLERGYALVRDPQGGLVQSAGQVNRLDTVDIRLKDGRLEATVQNVSYVNLNVNLNSE